MVECVFCKIIKKEIPANIIYEDSKHLAFLDNHPNRKGQSLVIPKKHYSGYSFEMPDKDFVELMVRAKKVGLLIDKALKTERTCLVLEGVWRRSCPCKAISNDARNI